MWVSSLKRQAELVHNPRLVFLSLAGFFRRPWFLSNLADSPECRDSKPGWVIILAPRPRNRDDSEPELAVLAAANAFALIVASVVQWRWKIVQPDPYIPQPRNI